MFNSKRIIFLIGLLSLVVVSGALLAGPAFAKKGNGNDGSKTTVCHYQEEVEEVLGVEVDANGDPVVEVRGERAEWAMINIDDKALPAHLGDGRETAAHTDGAADDFIVDDTDFDVVSGVEITSNNTYVCDDLVLSTLEIEVEVD